VRPIGSRNGRRPPGGYPELDDDRCAFLAGFLEGEACFSVRANTRGSGFRCKVEVNARSDDRGLIDALHRTTRLGRVTAVNARRSSRPQVSWGITAKSDCLRLVELLDRAPLRGRKSADWAIWRTAALAWIGDDPRCRRAAGDWEDLAYLAERLKSVKSFGAVNPPGRTDALGLDPDWIPYLAGFLTAEGCFGIYSNYGDRLRPVMRVNTRADDRPLLDELVARTRVGRTYAYPRRNYETSPVANWCVFSAADLRELVALLDGSPPLGKKGREYAIWRGAVEALDLPRSDAQPRLQALRAELAAARAYPVG
jgi:LAGLIDADG endonuclease